MDKYEKQLEDLALTASKQGAKIEEIENAIRKELEKSQVAEAAKKALEDRIIRRVTMYQNKAIFGLDTGTASNEPLVVLGNGMVIKADALAI